MDNNSVNSNKGNSNKGNSDKNSNNKNSNNNNNNNNAMNLLNAVVRAVEDRPSCRVLAFYEPKVCYAPFKPLNHLLPYPINLITHPIKPLNDSY